MKKVCVVEEASNTRRGERKPRKCSHCEYRKSVSSIVNIKKKKKKMFHIHCCEYILFQDVHNFFSLSNWVEKKTCNFILNTAMVSSKWHYTESRKWYRAFGQNYLKQVWNILFVFKSSVLDFCLPNFKIIIISLKDNNFIIPSIFYYINFLTCHIITSSYLHTSR